MKPNVRPTPKALLVIALATGPLAGLAAAAKPTDPNQPETKGIAAKYEADRGIAKDSDVVFADDFESWLAGGTQPPEGTWSVRKRNITRTSVIDGKVTVAGQPGPGKKVLEIACWTEGSGSQTGGLSRKLGNYNHAREGLGNGYEELYVRYYLKFDEAYHGLPAEYGRDNPIRVHVDNVVVARKYIGPLAKQAAK